MDQNDIMDHKDIMDDKRDSTPHHVEMTEMSNQALRDDLRPEQQRTTRFMVFFSLYIALAAWIYNFDLGKYPFTTY